MIWIIIISVAILIYASSRMKKKKLELNDEDLLLFYKYKEIMKGKIIPKRPDNLTEWEKHIWILASEDRNIESEKSFWKGAGIFIIALIVIAVIIVASS